MPQINVTLNGKQVACDSNQTIVEVAQEQGPSTSTTAREIPNYRRKICP